MKNEVFVLLPGYADWKGPGKQRASGTVTLIKGEKNVLADTGLPHQKDDLIRALKNHGLAPSDIDHVVNTHGQSDHIGNNNLFPGATFLLDTDVSRQDEFTVHDFASDAFHISEGISVIHTPGHTDHDVSVVVEAKNGTVVISGDIFECDRDWESEAWKAWSKQPERQQRSRERILRIATHIVPGHGDMFDAPSFADLHLGPSRESRGGAEKFLRSLPIAARIAEMARRFQTHYARVTEDRIREWLLQFRGYLDAQAVFPLLERIHYLDDQVITDIFREFYDSYAEETDRQVLFCLLGSMKDSSSQVNYLCSKAFKEWERKRFAFDSLPTLAETYDPHKVEVIFLDDMLGTGNQATRIFQEWLGLSKKRAKHVKSLSSETQEWLRATRLTYFAVVAFQEGVQHVEETLNGAGVQLNIRVGTQLRESDGCFDAKSLVFENPQVRLHAQKLAFEIGKELFGDQRAWGEAKKERFALGYGRGQKLIVFSYNTPNCSLPILWKDGEYEGRPWKALFPRRE